MSFIPVRVTLVYQAICYKKIYTLFTVIGHGLDHPPPPSAEVKEGVELFFYSPCGPSWPVLST